MRRGRDKRRRTETGEEEKGEKERIIVTNQAYPRTVCSTTRSTYDASFVSTRSHGPSKTHGGFGLTKPPDCDMLFFLCCKSFRRSCYFLGTKKKDLEEQSKDTSPREWSIVKADPPGSITMSSQMTPAMPSPFHTIETPSITKSRSITLLSYTHDA